MSCWRFTEKKPFGVFLQNYLLKTRVGIVNTFSPLGRFLSDQNWLVVAQIHTHVARVCGVDMRTRSMRDDVPSGPRCVDSFITYVSGKLSMLVRCTNENDLFS